MRRRGVAFVGMACATALVLSACGSDDEESGSGGGGDGATGTVDVGILTALSGPGAAAAQASIRGAEARFAAYEDAGEGCAGDLDFNIVEADDASSTAGALTGAQKLVQQDEVFAMINVSAFFYGASPFLTSQASTVPVFGGAWDGAEQWSAADDNLFNSGFVPNYETVYSAQGEFLAEQGATNVAGIAYTSPSSQGGLEVAIQSIEEAGLEVSYTNNSVQFGSTDVGPLVLGILDSGADAVWTTINFDTSLALVAGLRQAGWDGVFVSPTGYGADLLASAPAVQIGQGVIFSNAFTPVEAGTEATEQLKNALIEHSDNESGIPGFYESQGWFGADLFLYGLEQAGCDATQEELISTLQETDDWDGGGLYPTPIPQSTTEYDEQCSFYVVLEGDGFQPLNDGEPFCGTPLS
ncbi:ABC transporter substrate-binding protein [Trujillonella endophytica]|uniref:Branched-chain amino acid transport system substrate-binding protein n=1 Tax=Trujillonella endophytica TaxID=673521 RepID=A0A1H8W6X7_9ACTN|nr:ABC transporter substrate-binding protein [Trujillella endophytica]SEP23359.1 branched-chain amino acid transport system substrate-binding protein [Trujillella endophytica]